MTDLNTQVLTTITRRLEFDAGHRVFNHEGKCANLHGHRYVVEIVATAPQLDSLGRVIDFSILKGTIGQWIDDNWDHTTILFNKDEQAIQAVRWIVQNKAVFVSTFNPTAENMAEFLLREICPQLLAGTQVVVTKVIVHETPNCKAEACLI